MDIAPHPYNETISFQTTLAGEKILYFSKPGISHWDGLHPATHLLAENITVNPDGKVYVIGADKGALIVALSKIIPEGSIWVKDINFINLEMVKRTIIANRVKNAHIFNETSVNKSDHGKYDIVLIRLPKSRNLARKWLVEGRNALHEGGMLYIAGAKDMGINSVIKDGESLFGSSKLLAYKKRNRIARFIKRSKQAEEPKWINQPGIKLCTWFSYSMKWLQEELLIHSLPGVFSYDKVDNGTRMLLDCLEIDPAMRVLDLGCGSGIIGLVAAKAWAKHVTLVDVNLHAVASARKNIEYHKLKNIDVLTSDVMSKISHREFDLIATNPPFHIAKDVNYQITHAFIEQSWQHLVVGGRLLLVANKFIRYQEILRRFFNNITLVKESNHFYVVLAVK